MQKPVNKPIKFVKNKSTLGKSYPITHVEAVIDGNGNPISLTISNIESNINELLNMMLLLDSNLANIAFVGNRPEIACIINRDNLLNCTLSGDNAVLIGRDWSGILIPDSYMELPEEILISGNYDDYTYDSTTGDIHIKNLSSDAAISAEAPLHIPYIKDGLVFWLDGIIKGPNEDAWTDLIGGVVFENHGCEDSSTHPIVENASYKAVARDNCWEFRKFDGNNYTYTGGWLGAMGAENDLVFDRTTHTIEGVYQQTQPGGAWKADFNLCHLSTQTGNSFNGLYMLQCDGGWMNGCYIGDTNNVWSTTVDGVNMSDYNPHTVSMNKTRAMNNGKTLSSLGTMHWGGNGGGRFIGCDSVYNGAGKSDPKYFTPGKAYAIRVYNRILTEEEMLHNQRVDNERFNLGITTIPSE